jgi:CHAT domain-containing protein/Tfp pilus assembly protein PilF
MMRAHRGLRLALCLLGSVGTVTAPAQKASPPHWQKLTDQALTLKSQGHDKEALPIALEAAQEAEASAADDPYFAVTLECLGQIYEHLGESTKAEQLETRALAIAEKVLGPQDPTLTPYLNGLAAVFNAEGKLTDAEQFMERIVRIDEKALKPNDPDLAADLNNLASVDYEQGKYDKAQPLFERALRIDVKADPESAQVGLDLSSLGLLFDHQAKFTQAEPLLKHALAIDEKLKGADNPDVAMDLVNLGVLYVDQGHYDQAKELYERALVSMQKAFGPDHPNVAMVVSKLGLVEDHLGRYSAAEPLLQRALAIDQKALGPDHSTVATDLYNLAMIEEHQNHYADAEPLYQRALAIDEKALGPDHPDVANILENLAEIAFYESKYDQAEQLYLRAIQILEKAEGPDHTDVAHALDDLASLYDTTSRYQEAEKLDRRAIAIQEKALGSEHPDVANSLQALATLFLHQGRYAEAEPLMHRELAIREKALGPDSTPVADALNNLASLDYKEGKYADAEPLYVRAIRIDSKALGPDAPAVATDLNNTALLLLHERKYADARDLFERGLAIDEKALPDKTEVALCLTNLATVDEAQGKFADAEPRLKRAMSIDEKVSGAESASVAVDLNNLAVVYAATGRSAEAEALYNRLLAIHEKLLGPDHPDMATDLLNFAMLYANQGKVAQAQPLFNRSFDNLFHQFQYNFSFMTENERLGFLDTVAEDFPAYFSFVHRYHDKDPALIGAMYNMLLWEKGFISGSVADMRRQIEASSDPEALRLLARLAQDRTTMAALLNQQPQDRSTWQQQIQQLRTESDETEKALVQRSARFAERKKIDRTTWQQVRDALGPDEAAVEFARFRYYDGKWTDTSDYAALVITRESKDQPEYIPLGESSLIEGDAFTHFRSHLQTRGIAVEDAALPGQDAYTLLWKPVEPALRGKTRIYVSPDGIQNQIPLGIIARPDGKLLMEAYDLRIVSSTRDILRPTTAHAGTTALLVGNPVFALTEAEQRIAQQHLNLPRTLAQPDAVASVPAKVLRDQGSGTTLAPLPGTGAEINAIADLMQQRQWKTSIYTGDSALKRVLERSDSPRIIHLATHGFFLPDQQLKAADLESQQFGQKLDIGLEDPMLRSGLYFAGANRTLAGQPSAPDIDNGVFTAMEAANLDLRGTELVVLSACNTGQGDVKNGEGVFGLRRALEEAGAQHVLMSLWSVPDRETLELMKSFYSKWLAGTEVHAALQQAQLEMRAKVKAEHDGRDLPFYWGAFVLVGK